MQVDMKVFFFRLVWLIHIIAKKNCEKNLMLIPKGLHLIVIQRHLCG